MADIELMIKIPKELYEAYKSRPPMLGDAGMDMIAQAIANGILIPKGHSSLIDIQDVMKKVSLNYNSHQIIDAQSIKDIIRTTKIIIEADKEE